MTVLLNNVSVDTVSDAYRGYGGPIYVEVYADSFGGGTIFFETSRVGTNKWVPIYQPSISSPPSTLQVNYNDVISFELPVGFELRASLTGSSGASNVRVEVVG